MIKYFSDAEGYDLFKRYCPHANFIPKDLYNDWLEDIYCYGVSEYDSPVSLDEAKDLYVSLITLGIRVEGQQWIPANDFKICLKSYNLCLTFYHNLHLNISFHIYFCVGYLS